MAGVIAFFEELEDPRAANTRYDLSTILFIALAAVLCGATGCSDMADFARAKARLLGRIVDLDQDGTPSHDTFSRVFRLLDPDKFAEIFQRFTTGFAEALAAGGLPVVAIDGKALKGAFKTAAKSQPLHLVNVWAATQRLVLGQRLAPGRNEVEGALELLAMLDLNGAIVTADALHCHKAMAEVILERGGDYALTLKGNQAALLADATACFEAGEADAPEAETTETAHGRFEQRRARVVAAPELAAAHGFPGIAAVVRIDSLRRLDGREAERHSRYVLLSRRLEPAAALGVVRAHWGIENSLHWELDVVMGEDGARNRKDHGPVNLAALRRFALNILQTNSHKATIRRKIKRAGWDDKYLLELLSQMR